MGDSQAPVIAITDTKSDQTSKVAVSWSSIAPKVSEAISVTSNTALNVSLRSRSRALPTSAPEVPACPPDTSPADFYFPKASRNSAPFIDLVDNESISVDYKAVNTVVGGTSSNSTDSPAFWKAKQYKWVSSAPAAPAATTPETMDTSLFEKYIPSSRRNIAPVIKIKAPAGPWDEVGGYVMYDFEQIDFNPAIAAQLPVKAPSDAPALAASAVVAKYFPESYLNKAPAIDISGEESVGVAMTDVEVSEGQASSFRYTLST